MKGDLSVSCNYNTTSYEQFDIQTEWLKFIFVLSKYLFVGINSKKNIYVHNSELKGSKRFVAWENHQFSLSLPPHFSRTANSIFLYLLFVSNFKFKTADPLFPSPSSVISFCFIKSLILLYFLIPLYSC